MNVVLEALIECYRVEVESRGRVFSLDEHTKSSLQKIAGWLTNENSKPGLLLFGTVGNGKTTALRATYRLAELVFSDRSAYSRRDTGNRVIEAKLLENISIQTMSELSTSERLFIDDAGTESEEIKNYGNAITPLADIICKRYNNQKFTIISTNLKMEEMRDKYGDRVYDRIIEMFNRIAYNAPSYRS